MKVLEAIEQAQGTTNESMLVAALPWAPSTVRRHLRALIVLDLVEASNCQVTGNAQLDTTPKASSGLKMGLAIREMVMA